MSESGYEITKDESVLHRTDGLFNPAYCLFEAKHKKIDQSPSEGTNGGRRFNPKQ